MRKTLLLIVMLLIISAIIYGQNSLQIEFTCNPVPLQFSFYDYMIGSYNCLPLRTIPASFGGGYFLTYHSNESLTGTRRVKYAQLTPNGLIINNSYVSQTVLSEGYPTAVVDPVTGCEFVTWHSDIDDDGNLEIVLLPIVNITGIPIPNSNQQVVFNGPLLIEGPPNIPIMYSNFVWPISAIGPSPIAGKQRLYIVVRSSVPDPPTTFENYLIAYADFNSNDIENEIPLVFSYTTVPQLNSWIIDENIYRRANLSLAVDNVGNVFLSGYHSAHLILSDAPIYEPCMDVFMCSNYGEGPWTYYSATDSLPSWYPNDSPDGPWGLISGKEKVPVRQEEICWRIANSGHNNSTVDASGRIHTPALWALYSENYFYPNLQFLKEFVFDPTTQQFHIYEISPKKSPEDNFNVCVQPWDMEPPFGVTDHWTLIDGVWYPDMYTDWNFCLYDDLYEEGTLFFNYNNLKITEPDNNGYMVVLWQNSWRARQFNVYGDTNYAAFAETPEIKIAFTSGDGNWTEPVSINNVENPEMNSIVPMWAYPADKVVQAGYYNGNLYANLGLMFYDDYFWLANCISPAAVPNLGGNVMFAEVSLIIPMENEDNVQVPIAKILQGLYPNPFSETVALSLNLDKRQRVCLEIYNCKGQKVKTIFNGYAEKGETEISWNGLDSNNRKVANGLYFCKLKTKDRCETAKLIVLK